MRIVKRSRQTCTQPLLPDITYLKHTTSKLFLPKASIPVMAGKSKPKAHFFPRLLDPSSIGIPQDCTQLSIQPHGRRAAFRRKEWVYFSRSKVSVIHTSLAMASFLLSSSESKRFTVNRPWGCWFVPHLRWSTKYKVNFPLACILYSHSSLCKMDAELLLKNNGGILYSCE